MIVQMATAALRRSLALPEAIRHAVLMPDAPTTQLGSAANVLVRILATDMTASGQVHLGHAVYIAHYHFVLFQCEAAFTRIVKAVDVKDVLHAFFDLKIKTRYTRVFHFHCGLFNKNVGG